MKKMSDFSRSQIRKIEQTIEQCKDQETRLKSFAFLGAYYMASDAYHSLVKNHPEETDAIEKLQSVYKAAEKMQFSNEFPFSTDALKETLKETENLKDTVSDFAYRFAYRKLNDFVQWAKINKKAPEVIQQYADHLKGFHKDRSQNHIEPSGPSL
ncbi:hypothetical protein [Pseudomonas serbica]|uniref:hypothetical protein n=1 Tax=Pseudomonas serbica TaxID=2965074 RepID=UPI00237B8047|nr:hypothetical protein [Pseudomonas serbica]